MPQPPQIIKYLSHPRTGCNRSVILQLYEYNSLIRSQLDYGALIYSHTNYTALKLLDSIQSDALRLALGALLTSPTLSLCAEAGVPPTTVPLSISHRQLLSIHGPVSSNSYLSPLSLPSKLSSSLPHISD